MSLKVPNVGELEILDTLTGTWGTNLTLHLFSNNYTPVDGSVIGDFTEATYSGYGSQGITGWSAAAIVSGRASSTADPNTFAHNGGGTSNSVYGYYVTDAGGNLLFAERDPNAPVTMANSSQSYVVTPRFTLATEF